MAKTLHYDFVTDRSLAAKTGPTLSITRATDATYLGADGNIATASSGEARFPYDINAQSLGLLVEEARTNLALNSEDITAGSWGPSNASITTDAATAPDGSSTMDLLGDNSATGTGQVYVLQNFTTLSTSTTYTVSIFAKADQLDWFGMRAIAYNDGTTIQQFYDLTNGVTGTPSGTGYVDSGIEDYGNGAYRCWMSFATGADGNGNIRFQVCDGDADVTVDLDGTSSIFLWGAQLEAGAFPSSYIPTTTGSVTRNADDVENTSVTVIGSDGTLYVNFGQPQGKNNINARPVELNDGSTNNRVTVLNQLAADRDLQFFLAGSGTLASISETDNSTTPRTDSRFSWGWAADDVAVYVDGSQVGTDTDTGGATPTGIDQIHVGSSLTGNYWNGFIKEIAYWDERLDNATLEEYSTNGIPADAARNPYYMAPHKRTTATRAPRGRRGRRGGLRDM